MEEDQMMMAYRDWYSETRTRKTLLRIDSEQLFNVMSSFSHTNINDITHHNLKINGNGNGKGMITAERWLTLKTTNFGI